LRSRSVWLKGGNANNEARNYVTGAMEFGILHDANYHGQKQPNVPLCGDLEGFLHRWRGTTMASQAELFGQRQQWGSTPGNLMDLRY